MITNNTAVRVRVAPPFASIRKRATDTNTAGEPPASSTPWNIANTCPSRQETVEPLELLQRSSTNAKAAAAALGIVPLEDGLFRVGVTRVDRRLRTISIPAEVNQRQGIVPHALVHRGQRSQPAMFWTHTSDSDLRIACFLAGGFELFSRRTPRSVVSVDVVWGGPSGMIAKLPLLSLFDIRRDPFGNLPTWKYESFPTRPTGSQSGHPLFSLQPEAGALVSLNSGSSDEGISAMGALPQPGAKVSLVLRFQD